MSREYLFNHYSSLIDICKKRLLAGFRIKYEKLFMGEGY